MSGKRRAPLLLAAAMGIALAAALLRARAPGVTPAGNTGVDLTGVLACVRRVRAQLALAPVLAAEEALQRSPDDPQSRLRLADACAGSGDPAGAALALYPLLREHPELGARYARHCMDVGWLGEAAEALARLPATTAPGTHRTPSGGGGRGALSGDPVNRRAEPTLPGLYSIAAEGCRLELAAAYAQRGAAGRAAALLERLGREELAPEEWLEGSITWYHCRRLDRAVAWARQGVARAPADPAARGVLARCLLAAGRPEAALAALAPIDPTLATAPGAPPPVLAFWRGRAEARCRDAARRAAGREQLARVAAAEPGNAPAAFEAGRALLLAGEAGRAVPLLARAAVSGYQEVLCYEWLSHAYETLGHKAEALWARGRAQAYRGEFGAACTSLRRSLAIGPGKPLAYVDLARALHADGRLAEAVAVLERAEQTLPASLDIRLLKAKLLLHMERVADVTRELQAAAALDPKRANEPLGNLGTVYYDSQQFDRAVPVLEQAVQLEDADAHAHFYLGRVCARRVEEPQQAEKAVYHLLRAAEMQPDYSRPWMAAAAVLQRMGALPEAAACLRRAISGECQSDAPYVRLAQLLQLQGRHAERRLLLKQYAAVRDHDLTRTGLEKQTRDDPKDAARRYALGDLLLREGRPEKALPELLAAAGMRPGWKEARTRLADACAVLGYDDLRAEAEHAAR